MDMNLEDMIENLKEKLRTEEASCNSINIEKCLLEFKTELYIKRV